MVIGASLRPYTLTNIGQLDDLSARRLYLGGLRREERCRLAEARSRGYALGGSPKVVRLANRVASASPDAELAHHAAHVRAAVFGEM